MLDLHYESPDVLFAFPPLYYKIRFQKASKKTPHIVLIFKANNRVASSIQRLGFKGLLKNWFLECKSLLLRFFLNLNLYCAQLLSF
jgi:hypothetical protein